MISSSPVFAVNKPKQSSERDGVASWLAFLIFHGLGWSALLVLPGVMPAMRLWYLVRSDNKRRARLNCLAHLLSLIPYDKVPRPKMAVPPRATEHEYDDEASLRGRRFVPGRN